MPSPSSTWPEALLLLHQRGWTGEMIDEACVALLGARGSPPLRQRELTSWTPERVREVLREPIPDDESGALCLAADVHDRADPAGSALRSALRDLDAFVASLDGD